MTLAVRMLEGREPYDIYWAQELFEGRVSTSRRGRSSVPARTPWPEPGSARRELLARSYFTLRS